MLREVRDPECRQLRCQRTVVSCAAAPCFNKVVLVGIGPAEDGPVATHRQGDRAGIQAAQYGLISSVCGPFGRAPANQVING